VQKRLTAIAHLHHVPKKSSYYWTLPLGHPFLCWSVAVFSCLSIVVCPRRKINTRRRKLARPKLSVTCNQGPFIGYKAKAIRLINSDREYAPHIVIREACKLQAAGFFLYSHPRPTSKQVQRAQRWSSQTKSFLWNTSMYDLYKCTR